MLIIAHRGASGEFPENSLLAFEQAIVQGADGIELDIQFHHSSNTFIVLHDSYVDSLTSAQGHFNDFTLHQLQQLSLGQGQYIITLAQALTHIAGRTRVNIEFKSSSADHQEITRQLHILQQEITNAITLHQFSDEQFILSSFNHLIIAQCQKLLPKLTTAALIAHIPLESAAFTQQLNCHYLNLDIDSINQKLVDDAHHRQLQVWVYTVDKVQDIKRCQQMSVDAIFTNFPKTSRQRLNFCKEE